MLSVAAEEILELVQARSSPGVLILGMDNRVLYSNREALNLLEDSNGVLTEVRRLCERVKASAADGGPGAASSLNCALLWRPEGSPYSLRAFLLGGTSEDRLATHIMVLVENVTERHGINLKKAQAKFCLSDREMEVVAQLAQGLSNKEIACKLFISEHTVKDHLKNISRKMEATSRSEIIARLK